MIRRIGLSTLLLILVIVFTTTAVAEVDPVVDRVRTELAAAFDGESRDDEWATRSEALMQDAFMAADVGLGGLTIRCAETLCKIVFTAPGAGTSGEDEEEAIGAAIREAHYAGGMSHAFVSRDGDSYVAYFSREGFALPSSVR